MQADVRTFPPKVIHFDLQPIPSHVNPKSEIFFDYEKGKSKESLSTDGLRVRWTVRFMYFKTCYLSYIFEQTFIFLNPISELKFKQLKYTIDESIIQAKRNFQELANRHELKKYLHIGEIKEKDLLIILKDLQS